MSKKSSILDKIFRYSVKNMSPNIISVIFTCVSLIYVFILIYLTHLTPWFSTGLMVVTPIFLRIFGSMRRPKEVSNRLIQLIFIQHIFMVSVTLGVLAYTTNFQFIFAVAKYGFLAYFVVQTAGFILACIQRKFLPGVASSLLIGLILILWIAPLPDKSLVLSDSGKIYVFGTPAPWWVVLAYVSWFFVVACTTSTVPKVTDLIVHAASVLICSFSGQFFFARLMTASHLFVLDLFVNYSGRDFLGRSTLAMTDDFFSSRWPKVKSGIGWAGTVVLGVMLILVVANRLFSE